jgi:hypothetical protein
MKKLRSMLALVAPTLIIIVSFASPAAGATSSVGPAPALAAGQISSTQGPCTPGAPSYPKGPTNNPPFFGGGQRNDPNNPPLSGPCYQLPKQ